MSKSILYPFVIALLTNITTCAAEPPATTMPKAHLNAFLKQHCIRCHGPEEQNGQLRFDQVDWKITTNDTAQRWQDVLDVLNGGDMPPTEEPQPTADELSRVLDTLTGTLQKARRQLTDRGGVIAMRRLNRREYANSIRDLFGFHVPAEMIPEDNESAAFDTVGTDQYFTSSHFEKYLELGRVIARTGFDWAAKPHLPTTSNRRQPEERVTDRLRDKLADLDKKMEMKKAGKTWQEMGFTDAGEAEIIFSQFKTRAGQPRHYLQYPLVDSGIYLAEVNNETRRFGTNRGGVDPRAIYRYRVRAGIVKSPPDIRQFARITDANDTVAVVRIRGTAAEPQTVEVSYQPKIGNRNISLHVQENRADIRVLNGYLNKIDKDGDRAAIWVDWVEIEGPFYEAPRSFFETLVRPESPVRGQRTIPLEDKHARSLIQRFAFEAFRHRAPQPAYVNRLIRLFQKNRAEGQTFEVAMNEVVAVVLASPGFLFLQEATETEGQKHRLNARELAIRLAGFLWSSIPDKELYRLAKNDTLLQPDVLRSQVDRMLRDPKSVAFTNGFASQWAALRRFDAITVDESDWVRFNAGIRHSASREVLEFFRTLVTENLPAANLIDSDFVVVNSLLAQHYGIPDVTADEFQKVSLPANSPRGGLLGQTAFLTLGSNGERSSPVIRGALVMEKLLHDQPPPPPPNVPELGSDNKKPLSNRQLVELHQRRPQCASCHRKMDVIGFGLENFDVIGQWRDTERVGRKSNPIEPGGTLPDGTAFDDVLGLKAALLTEQHHLAQELIESLLAYSLGRVIEFSDADAVAVIQKRLQPENFRMKSMIHEIVASPLFQTK